MESRSTPQAITASQLAKKIDQTLLKQESTASEVESWALASRKLGFATLCIHPRFLNVVAPLLENYPTLPIAVIGFPLGTATAESKLFEAKQAIQLGAKELDVVISLSLARDKNWNAIREELLPLCELNSKIPVKLILETHLLTEELKTSIAEESIKWKISFLKTSTGFTGGGATVEDIRLLRKHADSSILIKASGGIKNLTSALALLEAGADRLGTSNGPLLLKEIESGISNIKAGTY